MALRHARPLPCWQVNDATTGQPPEAEDGEGWPHYVSETAALADLDERIQEWLRDHADDPVSEVPRLVAARSFARPCAVLVCDGCGEEWEDGDIGWSHHDPAGLDIDLEDYDWVEIDGRHYCPNCVPADAPPREPRVVVSDAQTALPISVGGR